MSGRHVADVTSLRRYAEQEALGCIARHAGMPPSANGTFVSGGMYLLVRTFHCWVTWCTCYVVAGVHLCDFPPPALPLTGTAGNLSALIAAVSKQYHCNERATWCRDWRAKRLVELEMLVVGA